MRLEELTHLQRIALLGDEQIFEFLWQNNVILFSNASGDLIQRYILNTSTFFEINLSTRFGRYVSEAAVVVDAGANIGNHPVYFAKICGAQRVHAFEPLRETFSVQKNVALSVSERVICHNLASGSGFGWAGIAQHFGNNIGTTQLASRVDGAYEVRPLDSFGFERIDAFKIDVEGYEVAVLEGAKESLARCKPIILIEILPEAGQRPHKFLVALGYERAEALGERDFIYVPKKA